MCSTSLVHRPSSSSLDWKGLGMRLVQYIPPIIHHSFCRVSWATIHSHKYSPGCIVAVKEQEYMPIFGEIQQIYIYNTSTILFHVEEFFTVPFTHHLHAYNVEIQSPEVLQYIHHIQLLDPVPLGLHNCYE